MIGELAAFLAVSAIVIVTPGQDTALTIRNTLVGGRRAGVLTAAGVSTGQAAWTLAASAGLAAVLQASEPAFLALRLAGAAYLVYLGIRQFLRKPDLDQEKVAALRNEPAWSMFRRGLWVNLLNPKAIVFFLAFMPQFIRPANPLLPQYAVLAATVVLIDILVMWFFFAAAAKSFQRFTHNAHGQTVLNRIFGVLFVVLGVLLAIMH